MSHVVIVGAKRTPVGKFLKSLSGFSAVQLGTIAAKAAMKSIHLDPQRVDQVIFGNVLQAGGGQNVARQIELSSGVPATSTAYTVNQVCGSGMRAIRDAEASILMGDAKVVIAGGAESMSNAPFICRQMRIPHKYGDVNFEDDLQTDALFDAFSRKPMGLTAETVAEKYQVTRQQQDRFALSSQQKAVYAQDHHYFDREIVPIKLHTRNGTKIMNQDECVRRDTSLKALSRLPSVFKENGTVTAGNASGLSDGASALILMSDQTAEKLGLKPLARIVDYAEAGIDPQIMGYAPYYATQKLLKRNHLSIHNFDLFELNEAFASQSIAVARDLHIPNDKLNINGGAIALGHPLGDSGSRIIATLLYNLRRTHQHRGLATLCIGGGMGMAMEIVC